MISSEQLAASTASTPALIRGEQLLAAPSAAKLLAISPRKLWAVTVSGEIPSVRIGRAVRYSVNDLADFIAANTKGGQQ